MGKTIESNMESVLRELHHEIFLSGSPEERMGEISRSRFNRAVSNATGCRNERRNTNGYWAKAFDKGYLILERPDPLSGRPQMFERARVREDIWTNCGFILQAGETMKDAIARTTKKSKHGAIEILDLRGMRP